MKALLALAVAAPLFGFGCASFTRAESSPRFCMGEESRGFDFWLGDWKIEQRILNENGGWITLPAETHVTLSRDGCVLTENWQGDVQFFWEGMTAPQRIWGHSVRRFDPADRTWSIYWMDSRKPDFDTPHVGGFADGRGEFFRDFSTPDGPRRSRIAFERKSGGEVYWELAISADGGASFSPIWTMLMTPAGRARSSPGG